MKRWMLLIAGLLLVPVHVQAQWSPEKTANSFKLSEKLAMTVWASEPAFVNPTCLDVDHKGRVWICESVNYRTQLRKTQPRRPEGDRILVLEDTKGEGKADKVTVFYQAPAIATPLGIAVRPHANGVGATVYVCQSPDILVFEDQDGDCKADGPPRKLLTGFGGVDHDHGVHGILIGPDSKLYFTVGDAGVKGLQSSDGKGPKFESNAIDTRAGTMWRCDLDGKNLERIAHNFRNNYEPCVDSFGTVFLSDNDNDGNQQSRICYVMKGGDYGYHRSPRTSHWNEEQPGVVPKILRTYFGSPTGICVYEGKLLPEAYQGSLLHCDAGPRHVRSYRLTPRGAAYQVEREDFVQSSDTWFRPTDVCVGPDGSVFVADWYDPGVGGHNVGDLKMGRVYRIAPSGDKSKVPSLDLQSARGIHAALASPNLAARAAAVARLDGMEQKEAIDVLEAAALHKDEVWLRARALWQLGRRNRLRLVTQAFTDPDPRFRVLSMRVLRDFQQLDPTAYEPAWQQRLLEDPSSAVRREALLLLQDVDPARAAPMIYALARKYDGKDRFYLEGVGIAVGHLDTRRRDAIFASLDKELLTEWTSATAGLLWELRPPQALSLLQGKLADARLPAEARAQIVDVLGVIGDASTGELLAARLAVEADAQVREHLLSNLCLHLAGKWSSVKQDPALVRAIEALLANPKQVDEGLALASLAHPTAVLPRVIALAKQGDQKAAVRAAAVRALGRFDDAAAQQFVTQVVQNPGDYPDAVALEAVQALGLQPRPLALDLLAKLVQQADAKLELRQAAVAGLASHQPSAMQLLDDAAKGKLAKDLTSELARHLRNSAFADVKKRAQSVLPAPPRPDPKNLPSIASLLARRGNLNNGQAVLAATVKNDAACLKCHTVHGVGGKVGPDLSVIGAKASRENLLESILYPSRAIAHQFETWAVETKGGLAIAGIVVEETPTHLVLRDASTKEYRLEVKDIDSKAKIDRSIMPDNLILYLSEEELIDLVEYLYSLKAPSFAPTSQLPRREKMGPQLHQG